MAETNQGSTNVTQQESVIGTILKNKPVMLAIGAVAVGIIIAVVIASTRKSKEGEAEGFVSTPYGASVTPEGAIIGPVVYTNSLVRGDPNKLLDAVKKDGTVRDESCIVLGSNNGKEELNNAFKRQLKVMDLQSKSNNGFQKVEDLKEISKQISQDNGLKGMFMRDTGAQSKLVIDKYATIGVIDEKYMPNRDRPKELRAVGTAIMMPGFAFDATKALDSNGTGICPKGGVPGVGIERNKKRTTNLLTIAKPAEAAPAPAAIDETLKANNVSAATTVV